MGAGASLDTECKRLGFKSKAEFDAYSRTLKRYILAFHALIYKDVRDIGDLSDLAQRRKETKFDVVVVGHSNHSQEITNQVKENLNSLRASKVNLLNQSVLLAGVNDDSQVLKELSQTLISLNILPYYLHLPDKVSGTSHFSVSSEKAIKILNSLRDELPGYLVPNLVQEEPGELSKTRLV